jgi:hypothetical protein
MSYNNNYYTYNNDDRLESILYNLMDIIYKLPGDNSPEYTEKIFTDSTTQIHTLLDPLTPEMRDDIMSMSDIQRTGNNPYVYAYLKDNKQLTSHLLDTYVTDYLKVLNAQDSFDYTFMDYAIQENDIPFILWIHNHGGKANMYRYISDDLIKEELHNPPNNNNVVHRQFNNENYRKIVRLLKKKAYGPIRGFHGTPLALRSSRLPITSKKLAVYNNEKYNTHAFLKPKYTVSKNIIIQSDLSKLESWKERQSAYLNKTPRRRFVIQSYTHHGDVLVNKFLRGQLFISANNHIQLDSHVNSILSDIIIKRNVTIPFLYQIYDMYDELFSGNTYPKKDTFGTSTNITVPAFSDFCKRHIDVLKEQRILEQLLGKYAEELNHIIRNAPRLPYTIKTYRGATTEYHIPDGVHEYTYDGFTSTSLSPSVGFAFTHSLYPTVRCCVYEMTVPRGLPVVYLEDITEHKGEYEILMPLDIRVDASSKLFLKRLHGYTERALVREVSVKGIHRASPRVGPSRYGKTMRKFRVKRGISGTQKNKVPAGGAGRGSP